MQHTITQDNKRTVSEGAYFNKPSITSRDVAQTSIERKTIMRKLGKRFLTFVLVVVMIFSFPLQVSAATPKWLGDLGNAVVKTIETVVVKPIEWAVDKSINNLVIPLAEQYAEGIVNNPERALAGIIVGEMIPVWGPVANIIVGQGEALGIIPPQPSITENWNNNSTQNWANQQSNSYGDTYWGDGYIESQPQSPQTSDIHIWASGGGRIGFNGCLDVRDGDFDSHSSNGGTWATYTIGQGFETHVFVIEPNNVQFLGWYENDQLLSTNVDLYFIATHDRNLEARFSCSNDSDKGQQQTYQVIEFITTFDGVFAGDTTASQNNATPGTLVYLSAEAYDGFVFNRWEVRDGSPTNVLFQNPNSPNTSFSMPSGDIHIVARFTPQQVVRYINLFIGFPEMDTPHGRIPIDSNGTSPVILNGRTLLPVRAIIEEMGGSIEWIPNGGGKGFDMVMIDINSNNIQMCIGHEGYYINGYEVSLEVPPKIINGRTMVPARALFEAVGFIVEWIPNGGGYGKDMVSLTYFQ